MPRIAFTTVDKELIQQAAKAIWNEIAYDCMVANAEEGHDTIGRDTVVELVLDCDRLMRKLEGINPDLAERVGNAMHSQVLRIVRDAFPYSEYE